jgi:flagellar motor switch protein FliN/FliY
MTSEPIGSFVAVPKGDVRKSIADAVAETVHVKLEAFLGETTISVAELQALTPNRIVSLDASLAEVIELRVNGVKVAEGELVSVGDRFGVRITAAAQS